MPKTFPPLSYSLSKPRHWLLTRLQSANNAKKKFTVQVQPFYAPPYETVDEVPPAESFETLT